MAERAAGRGIAAVGARPLPELVRRLIALGLLEVDDVVDGRLELRDLSARNHGILVTVREGSSYFLKEGADADGAAAVARERSRYRELHADAAAFGSFLLSWRDLPSVNALVLEGLPRARDLHEHHRQLRRFPVELGGQLGRALGLLHHERRVDPVDDPGGPPPWVLAINRPSLDDLREVGPATMLLLEIIQGEVGLTEELDRLRSEWRSESLIHGDVRWANVLVEHPDAAAPGIRLIDWELASGGDPAWDLGCAMSSYLSFWIFSIPETTEPLDSRELARLAECPLEEMWASVGQCWSEYVACAGHGDRWLADGFGRMMRYSAARLLQIAFESSFESETLDRRVVLHVQLAANIMARPEASARDLLGLMAPVPTRT